MASFLAVLIGSAGAAPEVTKSIILAASAGAEPTGEAAKYIHRLQSGVLVHPDGTASASRRL